MPKATVLCKTEGCRGEFASTAGGDLLRLQGVSRGTAIGRLNVFVGCARCVETTWAGAGGTLLQCLIPPGSGRANSVTLQTASGPTVAGDLPRLSTAVVASLSYAPPVVSAVSGCAVGGCRRRGGERITVRGRNFAHPTVVFVNNGACRNVTVAEGGALMECTLPPLGVLVTDDAAMAPSLTLVAAGGQVSLSLAARSRTIPFLVTPVARLFRVSYPPPFVVILILFFPVTHALCSFR